jgi:hypothetical protein
LGHHSARKRDREDEPEPPEARLSQRRLETDADNPLGPLLCIVQHGQKQGAIAPNGVR